MKTTKVFAFIALVICCVSTSPAAPLYSIVPVGLVDFEHTRNDGYVSSSAEQLNEAGQVRGHSSRYNGGSSNLGVSAWLFNATTTVDIGLVGSGHTRIDGYKYSVGGELNEAGQVWGYSNRYDGGSASLGQSARIN